MSNLIYLVKSHALGMWRFRWLAIGVAWLICLIGWTIVYMMPDIYSASARVFVDPENAIENYMGGIAAPTNVMGDVGMVVREIVSRPNLAEVARKTDLAARAVNEEQFENLLTSLQDRISVSGNSDGIFSISFEDRDRDKALAVVDTLLNAFVQKSLGADRTDSKQAQQFLRRQIAEYEQRLTAAENKLADFKRKNVALMPDQRGDYFSRLQAEEAALQVTTSKYRLATEKRAELERQIEGEEPVFGIVGSETGGRSGMKSSYSGKIRELEAELDVLRLQYTDKYPRIGQILDTVKMLKAQEAEEIRARTNAAATNPLQQNPLDLNPVYQNMRIQLSKVEVDVAALRVEKAQQESEVKALRTMVDTIPQVEAELKRLNRDYDVVKGKHQQLLQQLETANIGEDVSRSSDDVVFRIIDPPFSDTKPSGPNRTLFLGGVLVLALGAGGVLAFIIDLMRPTFIGSLSVQELLGIPVLAAVSLLQTEKEKRAERNSRLMLQLAALVLLVSFTVVTVFSDLGSNLVRGLIASVT
ncbi:MAG TPA: chain-length determining protein [Woeseiaceae bacterium]|nr:chain-length determining protein [Woeseiaceae bacterium]